MCKLPVLHGFLSASLDYLRRCVHACLEFSPLCVFSGCANSFTLCASTDFMCILGLPWTSDDGSVLGLHLHSPPVFFTGRTHSLCSLGDFFCLYKWIYLDMDPLCLSSVSFLDYSSVTSTVYSFTGAWGLLDHTEFRLASVLWCAFFLDFIAFRLKVASIYLTPPFRLLAPWIPSLGTWCWFHPVPNN